MLKKTENGKRGIANGIKKHGFFLLFFLCGALYLTYVDHWQVYIKIWEPVKSWWQEQAGDNGTEDPNAADPEEEDEERADYFENVTVSGNSADKTVSGGDGQPEDADAPSLPADPEQVVYETVEDNYFADAVFIGDSRTVGMYEYGGLEEISTFYASKGLTIYRLLDAPIVEKPGQKKKASIEEMLSEKQFAKIYLMVGINEMGTGTTDTFLEKYKEVLEHLRELQPDALIYVQGIMKVTTERSEKGDYITNEGIEARNQGLSSLADNVSVYYLDVNPLICDETGGMESSYTFDGVHLKAQYVTIWKEFLKSHAVKTSSAKFRLTDEP